MAVMESQVGEVVIGHWNEIDRNLGRRKCTASGAAAGGTAEEDIDEMVEKLEKSL